MDDAKVVVIARTIASIFETQIGCNCKDQGFDGRDHCADAEINKTDMNRWTGGFLVRLKKVQKLIADCRTLKT